MPFLLSNQQCQSTEENLQVMKTSTSNFLYFPFLIIQLSYDSAHEKLIDRLSRSEALMCPFFHWYIELLQYAGF